MLPNITKKCHRTFDVCLLNITKYIVEHRIYTRGHQKIQHRTLYVHYMNIACICKKSKP
jgi:hypothetical protein